MCITIGKLAKQAGVTIETVRHYQRKGLLKKPEKPIAGYRQYPSEAIARIRFIKRAQKSGFNLKEISELLSLDSAQCEDVRKIAEHKRQQIDARIEELTSLRNVLENLVKGCQNNSSSKHCTLIDALSKEPAANSGSSKNSANSS